jgi:membrane-bound serine protease (ClpP class)
MRRSSALALLLAPLLLGAAPTPTTTPVPTQEAAPSGEVLLLVVDGMINLATADYLQQGMAAAVAGGAPAVVVQLDTPGGLLESTKVIVKDILSAPLPVIVYVAPSGGSATSAGVFVTLAANIAAMAPGTSIGAAHPVGGKGEDIAGDMREKVENFTVSLVRSIAEQRGRNVEWAEKAVRQSVSITEREAVKLKVVDFVADNIADVLAKAHGRTVEVQGRKVVLDTANAPVRRYEMSLRQRLLDLLANPNIAYLLMMAGLLGLYVEFTNPGGIFPGVAGAICLILAFYALQTLPINYAGLLLIMLGIGLFIAEAFTPTYGVLGVGGAVSMILGSIMLIDSPAPALQISWAVIIPVVIVSAVLFIITVTIALRVYREKPDTGVEGIMGLQATAKTDIHADGQVFMRGEYWRAWSDEPIQKGEKVTVIAVEGLKVKVRKGTEQETPAKDS